MSGRKFSASGIRSADDEPLLMKRKSPQSEYQNFRNSASSQFYGETESHQYEQDESEVWKHHQLQRFSMFLPNISIAI